MKRTPGRFAGPPPAPFPGAPQFSQWPIEQGQSRVILKSPPRAPLAQFASGVRHKTPPLRLPTLILNFSDRWQTLLARRDSLILFERVVEYPLPFAGLDVKAGPEARSLPAWLAMRLEDGELATSTDSFQNRTDELRRFKTLGCVGILDVTCPQLVTRTASGPAVPESGRSKVGWMAQVRQMFVVPYDRADEVAADERISGKPHPAFGIVGTVRLKRHVRLDRRELMKAVARAMAYPKMLLHGPAELALEVLQARAPYRLITTTGTFRHRAGRADA
jgi:hypothetical protein